MKIAIVGSGISGLAAASSLFDKGHKITVFESNDYIGGHSRSVQIPLADHAVQEYEEPTLVELGTFMFDPKYIHPLIGSKAQELGIKMREFPVTFSFENHKYNTSWTTKSQFSGTFRNLSVLFNTIKTSLIKGCLHQNVSFLLELNNFIKLMPEICNDEIYRKMSLQNFMDKNKYSSCFLDNWLLPQVLCWWGMPKEHAMSTNIQVIAQSMYYVSLAPQYMFVGGWSKFIDKLIEPFSSHIRTSCPVSKVLRMNGKIEVTAQGRSEIYDHLIFAIPPSAVRTLLQHPQFQEDEILKSFLTTTTTVYMHNDKSWLPVNQESSLINLIQDQRGDFCTIKFAELDHRLSDIFITWGDGLQEVPEQGKTTLKVDWLRTLPTLKYTDACYHIQSIQGNQGIWYCGAHVDALDPKNRKITPSLWHENSYKSGLDVAKNLLTCVGGS